MFDKTFDTIVDIISEFTDFVIYKLSRTKKKKKKKIMTNLYARYLYNILQQFITDTYISQSQFDTYLYFVCINNNLLDIANFEICNIHLLFTKCVHTYVYTCKMNFSALHNHSLSNKQCVVDVFFDNVRLWQRDNCPCSQHCFSASGLGHCASVVCRDRSVPFPAVLCLYCVEHTHQSFPELSTHTAVNEEVQRV